MADERTMATQLDRTDSDSTIIGASDLYPDKHACALSTQRNATTIEWSRHQLWVGYMLSSQFWLDILELSGSTERHLRDLCSWWEVRVPKWHRMKNRMLFCKRPIVVIGTLPQVRRQSTGKSTRLISGLPDLSRGLSDPEVAT